MNIDQDLQGEPTFINQGQQVEQAADQAVEQAPVVEGMFTTLLIVTQPLIYIKSQHEHVLPVGVLVSEDLED